MVVVKPAPCSPPLGASAFGSPNVDVRDAASSASPLSAPLLPRAAAQGTKNTRGWVSVPIVNPISQFNRRFISNSHRITSFAYPRPLTPIESYLCKKQGRGSPPLPAAFFIYQSCQRTGTPVYPEPWASGKPFPLMGLLHDSLDTPGSGGPPLPPGSHLLRLPWQIAWPRNSCNIASR